MSNRITFMVKVVDTGVDTPDSHTFIHMANVSLGPDGLRGTELMDDSPVHFPLDKIASVVIVPMLEIEGD